MPSWRLRAKDEPDPVIPQPTPAPTPEPAPKAKKTVTTRTQHYGKPGNPHDQFIADLIKGLEDGTILMRSVDVRRVTSHPYTEMMVELLDTGNPTPSRQGRTGAQGSVGPTGARGSMGATGATGPQTVHHLGHSHSSVMGTVPAFSSATSMVAKVAALPGARTYGLKVSSAEEPLVGYRDFKLTQGGWGYFLQSRNGAVWPHRKKMSALCNGNPFAPHDVPEPTCQCGIYAYDKPDNPSLTRDSSSLWGEIAMWGEVLVCDTGFRAEFAYPTALFMRKPSTPATRATRALEATREELEDSYGVPVFILAERASKTASQLMQEILQEQLGDILKQPKEET